jgi:hypothetical protein
VVPDAEQGTPVTPAVPDDGAEPEATPQPDIPADPPAPAPSAPTDPALPPTTPPSGEGGSGGGGVAPGLP